MFLRWRACISYMHIYAIGGAVGVGQATTDTAFGPDVRVAESLGGDGRGGTGTAVGVDWGRGGRDGATMDTASGPDLHAARCTGGRERVGQGTGRGGDRRRG